MLDGAKGAPDEYGDGADAEKAELVRFEGAETYFAKLAEFLERQRTGADGAADLLDELEREVRRLTHVDQRVPRAVVSAGPVLGKADLPASTGTTRICRAAGYGGAVREALALLPSALHLYQSPWLQARVYVLCLRQRASCRTK